MNHDVLRFETGDWHILSWLTLCAACSKGLSPSCTKFSDRDHLKKSFKLQLTAKVLFIG